MPVYVRGQSHDRASQANMGKLFGTNAPGITLNDISSRTIPIDEVLVLREAKRINSDIRRDFSTFAGRQKARDSYICLLSENPCRVKVFQRLLDYIHQLLDNEP